MQCSACGQAWCKNLGGQEWHRRRAHKKVARVNSGFIRVPVPHLTPGSHGWSGDRARARTCGPWSARGGCAEMRRGKAQGQQRGRSTARHNGVECGGSRECGAHAPHSVARRARHTEVAHGGAGAAATAQQHGVGALGLTQSQLVEGQGLATRGQDARAGALGEAQGADLQLGHGHQADIIRHSAHHHRDLVLLALHVARNAGQAHGRPVDAAHVQALQHHLVEARLSAAGQEAVQLRRHAHDDRDGREQSRRARGRAHGACEPRAGMCGWAARRAPRVSARSARSAQPPCHSPHALCRASGDRVAAP